jgi:hypothetical protein
VPRLLTPYTCRDGASSFQGSASLLQSGNLVEHDEPVWLDVSLEADPDAVAAALGAVGLSVTPELARALSDPADRPQPQLASAASQGGPMRFWAFGASVEGSIEEEDFALLLHPVGVLAEGNVIVTRRQVGIRCQITSQECRPTAAPPLGLERMLAAASSSLAPLVRPGEEIDRDVVFFALLGGLVVTLFGARAELGQAKVAIDSHYFEELIASRARAASSDLRSQDVARAAREAGHRVEQTRRRLASVQQVATVWRRWFDDLKPPGLPFKQAVWLPEANGGGASEHLVDRIYQVRNDLRSLRTEVHQSMALLATADTGSQLLAVRALLDRTESARSAAVVAGVVTLLVAAVGVSAAVAAIPSENARFLPISKALAVSALLVIGSVAAGGLVAILSRQAPPPGQRIWMKAGSLLFGLGAVAIALSLLNVGGLREEFLIAGGALVGIALAITAYAGDFGQRRQASLLYTACSTLLKSRRSWSGSAIELAGELAAGLRSSRSFRSGRGHRTRKHELDRWLEQPEYLVQALREEAALLDEAGCSVRVNSMTGRITISRSEVEASGGADQAAGGNRS